MEKIDKQNYEAYFLDYMEGTLSAEEKHELFVFLEANPALKQEFELDFEAISLFPEEYVFDQKDELKIDEADLIITPNTLPDLMVASVEKQLAPKHDAQLAAYIRKAGLEKTFSTYQKTILRPDLNLVYAEKERLKQKTGLIISMTTFKRIAAVAAIGLVMVTFAVNWNNLTNDTTIQSGIKFGNDPLKSKFFKQFQFDSEAEDSSNDLLESEGTNDNPKSPANPKDLDSELDNLNHNFIVEELEKIDIEPLDSLKNMPNIKGIELLPDNQEIVKKEDEIPVLPLPELDEEEIFASVRHEEPYKIVTDAAANLVNKDVKFTRDRNVVTNDYVAYSFQLGSFGFEHKKSSK